MKVIDPVCGTSTAPRSWLAWLRSWRSPASAWWPVPDHPAPARGDPTPELGTELLGTSMLVPPPTGFTANRTVFSATIDAGYTWLALLAVATRSCRWPTTCECSRRRISSHWRRPCRCSAATGACGTHVVAGPLLSRFQVSRLLPG